jgi:3-mercaptopyruvate sulfurtransferase SseA
VNRRYFFGIAGITASLCIQAAHGEPAGTDPWSSSQLMEPALLAKMLRDGKQPLVVCVGFPVLYRQKHIAGSVLAGPAGKREGIAKLKEALATTPQDAEIVIYCGCCPMVHCPNLRPAFSLLTGLGYKNVRVLDLPTNFRTDWEEKGYPMESSLPQKS